MTSPSPAQQTKPTYPDPASLGEVIEGWVESLPSNLLNVRAQTSTSAAIVGRLRVGDRVRWRKQTTAVFDGYRWWALEEPRGWIVATATLREEARDNPLVLLSVPFRSQLGAQAGAFNKDCGAACANMLFQFALVRAGLSEAKAISVDDMARDSDLAIRGDKGLTPEAVARLLGQYGVSAQAVRPLRADNIVRELDESRPVIALVKYEHIRKDIFTGGHYVVVVGYGELGFWLHDPYNGGPNLYVSREALASALADTSSFASFPNQGVTLRP